MTKQTEAMKLALEAITTYLSESPDPSEEAVEGLCDAASILKKSLAEQPAQQEPVAWRELCRRLYVELFHCDQQMMATLDEEGDPMWQQGATVRDVLADARDALEASPPAQRTWVGLTNEEAEELWESTDSNDDWELMKRTEAKLRSKNT